jgi:hypothetical protein
MCLAGMMPWVQSSAAKTKRKKNKVEKREMTGVTLHKKIGSSCWL